MWALRDAVAFAGHGRSAREALDFYQRLADEINAACDRGDLPAGPPRATMFPPWQSRYTGDFFADLPRFVAAVVFFTDFNAEVPPSQGDADQLRLFRDLTQWYISPAPEAPVFDTPTGTIARSYRVGALNIAGRVMGWMCSAVVLGGLLAWPTAGIRSARRRCWPSFTWWLAAGCLGTTAAIVLINLLVNVTSFPQFGPGAFAQAYPLMVLFGVLAVRDLLTPDAPRSGASEL